MGDKTGIQWTDATWNPVSGCTKVSQGCKNCYAERVFPRPYGRQQVMVGLSSASEASPITRPRKFTDVAVHPDRLDQPLRWKRPHRVFVNSMSDLFHESVTFDFIDKVFAVMQLAPQHVFQILTKRPERMYAYARDAGYRQEMIGIEAEYRSGTDRFTEDLAPRWPWPLPNVWLGVSCEDQATADERIPLLLQTPAAVRFVSAEPLLGPIDFCHDTEIGPLSYLRDPKIHGEPCGALDWVIVGGESGPKARPCELEWVCSIRDQCKAAGVACFIKQLGTYWARGRGIRFLDTKGGDPAEWPEDLRVREFPA